VDRYIVERLLGQGGTAEVWAVRHRLLGSLYALKIRTRSDPGLNRRLLAEGRAQARLDHPNILAVRSVLDVDGQPALVMPLLLGPSLQELIRFHPPNAAESLAILKLVLDALRFAHRRGFIHRDLKPANILLDVHLGAIRPRIADFGLVKEPGGDHTPTGVVFGPPGYIAPAQLRAASSVDARAALFSSGELRAELLPGQ